MFFWLAFVAHFSRSSLFLYIIISSMWLQRQKKSIYLYDVRRSRRRRKKKEFLLLFAFGRKRRTKISFNTRQKRKNDWYWKLETSSLEHTIASQTKIVQRHNDDECMLVYVDVFFFLLLSLLNARALSPSLFSPHNRSSHSCYLRIHTPRERAEILNCLPALRAQ